MPALLTSAFTGPCAARTAATSAAACSRSVRSATNENTPASSAARSWTRSVVDVIETRAPSRTSNQAHAKPMPSRLPQPLTSACRPSNRKGAPMQPSVRFPRTPPPSRAPPATEPKSSRRRWRRPVRLPSCCRPPAQMSGVLGGACSRDIRLAHAAARAGQDRRRMRSDPQQPPLALTGSPIAISPVAAVMPLRSGRGPRSRDGTLRYARRVAAWGWNYKTRGTRCRRRAARACFVLRVTEGG